MYTFNVQIILWLSTFNTTYTCQYRDNILQRNPSGYSQRYIVLYYILVLFPLTWSLIRRTRKVCFQSECTLKYHILVTVGVMFFMQNSSYGLLIQDPSSHRIKTTTSLNNLYSVKFQISS